MGSRWYEIEGFTKEMFEKHRDQIKPEVNIWSDGDKIRASMILNLREASQLRKSINAFNKQNPKELHFKLIPMKV